MPAPHDLVDVAGELGVGHAQARLAVLVDGLDRPAGIELGGDGVEMRDEGNTRDALHAFTVGWPGHPMLRT